MEVQDIPLSRTRKSLGEGVVLETRLLGRREQVLVEFPGLGQRHWLPYENLRQIKGPRHGFCLVNSGSRKCREVPSQVTGSCHRAVEREYRFAVPPGDRSSSSPDTSRASHPGIGNINWLIADDVGLGKTIEVGNVARRIEQRGLPHAFSW